MNKSHNDVGLIIAIIFASAAISGSLVFFGLQMVPRGGSVEMDWGKFVTKVEEGVGNFIKKGQQDQAAAQQQAEADASQKAKNIKKPDSSRDHIRGNANAEISLIEYSDYVCPYCARFHETAKQVVEQYGGKVNWIFRHYPLPGHDPMATKVAEGAECANAAGGADKFWSYTDKVFESLLAGAVKSQEDVIKIAESIGMDKLVFSSCLESGKFTQRIKDDFNEGDAVGVTGTPGNILLKNSSGVTSVINGAQPLEMVKKSIDELLSK